MPVALWPDTVCQIKFRLGHIKNHLCNPLAFKKGRDREKIEVHRWPTIRYISIRVHTAKIE